MKVLTTIFVCLFLLTGIGLAAAIDGKWVSERKFDRSGEPMTIKSTFELKAEGSTLTGTVVTVFGEKEMPKLEIRDGKIDGDKFSFSVVMSSPRGEFKTVYEGTVEGDTLKGTATGRRGPNPFEAKRM
jgi:hypothetical protein